VAPDSSTFLNHERESDVMKPHVSDEETKSGLDPGYNISFGRKPPFAHNKLTNVKSVEELASSILEGPSALAKPHHA